MQDESKVLERSDLTEMLLWQGSHQKPFPKTFIQDATNLDVRTVINIFWRRRWFTLFCIVTSLVLGQLYLQRATRLYTASSEILVADRNLNITGVRSVLNDLNQFDRHLTNKEQRVIKSSQLLDRAIDRLNLMENPEFNPRIAREQAEPGIREQIKTALKQGALSFLFNAEESTAQPAQDVREANERQIVLKRFSSRVKTEAPQFSNVIILKFTSRDPEMAALAANTIVELYTEDQLEAKFEASRRASTWLSTRLETLKVELEVSEEAVAAFEREQLETAGQSQSALRSQRDTLTASLSTALTERAAAEALYRQATDRVDDFGLDSAANISLSDLITTLRGQLSELERREAELAARFGERHPQLINVRKELLAVESSIKDEAARIVTKLESDVVAAQEKVDRVRATLAGLENRVGQQAEQSVKLRQLQREAEANRFIYENFLNRFRAITAQEDLHESDSRILSYATALSLPSSPNSRKIMLVFGFMGIAFALVTVGIKELFSNTYRSPQELATSTGRNVMASLSVMRSMRGKPRKFLTYLQEKPNSSMGESLRALRTAISLVNVDNPPKKLMVTSALASEGKSTTSLLTAYMTRLADKKVVLVDTDFRRPTLHKTFDIPESQPGLLELLNDEATLKEVSRYDEQSGVSILHISKPVPQAADILSSNKFKKIVQQLEEQFDLVILDTPPVMLVSDALILGRMVDTAVFIVRWNHTRSQAVKDALNKLAEANVHVAGCVLTQVKRRKEAAYGYNYYKAGYGYYTD